MTVIHIQKKIEIPVTADPYKSLIKKPETNITTSNNATFFNFKLYNRFRTK